MKECRLCKLEKPIEEFAKKKDAKDGIRSECKSCHNAYYRKYYRDKDKMDKHIQRVALNKKQYRWDLSKYKLEKGCSICGYNKCARSLHFHHLDRKTKEFEISRLARNISYNKLQEEIKKCTIVCSNCHGELEEKIEKNGDVVRSVPL